METRAVRRPKWRIYAWLAGTALALYLSAYAVLSLQGRYEALVWGIAGVKARLWVPRGFETAGEWNRGMVWGFAPLFMLDRWYWHTSGEADSGRYPVNGDDYYIFGKRPSSKTVPNPNSH
jgi:hypothetical protein